MNLDLSIIIVNFNTKQLIKRCLESILVQKTAVNFEIAVIDNNSADDSVETIKRLQATNHPARQRVRSQAKSGRQLPITIHLIENKENVGFAKAVNQGISLSKGKNILLLNSDTQLLENCLNNLTEFSKNNKPAIIGLQMLNPDMTPQASVFHFPSFIRAIEEFWFDKTGSYSKYIPVTKNYVEVDAVSGGGMYITEGVLDKIGMFDERYFFYFEDLDYCRKARENKIKVYYLSSAKIIHEHGASGKNLANPEDQWKRLIPSSKIYHGILKHYLINLIIIVGQKLFH